MTREYKSNQDPQRQQERGDDGSDRMTDQARAVLERDRRRMGSVRQALNGQVDRASKAMLLGANLFQMMARGEDEAQLERKLSPEIAEKISDKVVDKVAEHIKSLAVEASGIGEVIAENSASVFGALKGTISEKISARKDLTVLQCVDLVSGGIIERATIFEQEMKSAVAGLGREKLLGVHKTLSPLKDVRSDEDSPETGKLADGLQEWALTDLVGLPAGGGVVAEEWALRAWSEFQAGVRDHAMSAGERSDAIQERLANPRGDQDKLEAAEEKLKPETKKEIEKDKILKERTYRAEKP